MGAPAPDEDPLAPPPTPTEPLPPVTAPTGSHHDRQPIPYRVILATIGLVLATYVAVQLAVALQRILTWLVVAGFLAIVLNPAVDFLVVKARLRRTVGALLVFVVGFGSLGALLYAFIRPIVSESSRFADQFPTYVADAKAGRGEVGKLVKRYHIDQWVTDNKDKLKQALQNSGQQALTVARKIGDTAAAVATILVLTWLMLVEGPRMLEGGTGMLSPPWAERLKRMGRESSRAITGYMAGNLLISLIAGVVTYSALWAFGVPFRTVMALWVGFADLIPLIGAMLGAIPTVLVALLHSPTAAVGMIIVYVVYQQFENHVLQVGIMSRTVRLSPLAVLVSLVVGVQLSGLLGALLAIPVAGVIQVVAKDIYQERRRARFVERAADAHDDSSDHVTATSAAESAKVSEVAAEAAEAAAEVASHTAAAAAAEAAAHTAVAMADPSDDAANGSGRDGTIAAPVEDP